MEIGANRDASLTPSQSAAGCGARQRFSPIGGAANGIPLNTVILGSAASIPRTHPFSVFASRIIKKTSFFLSPKQTLRNFMNTQLICAEKEALS